VWLDEQLTLRSEFDGVVRNVAHQAKRFFKAAKPVLKILADR